MSLDYVFWVTITLRFANSQTYRYNGSQIAVFVLPLLLGFFDTLIEPAYHCSSLLLLLLVPREFRSENELIYTKMRTTVHQ